ncbi:glutamyl aminopeptidase [Stomoxys calcitrans]|uniref:glutamyl aminopeptidase n=1 Tax=Stomoxys calcitrans TaxID=35570 RepID=UPI0027E266F2|nr:glutamyl aminopeptidase [Stomoxys calcitrans]
MLVAGKFVTIILGMALTAFTVSTIVLAVQKSNLKSELEETRDKLDKLEEALKTTTTTTTTTASPPTTEDPSEQINYRLPGNLVPTYYNLYLHPDIATGMFSGQVIIDIDCVETTDEIILHSLNMTIKNVYVTNVGSSTNFVTGYELDGVREFLVIHMAEDIVAPRKFQLGILFEGSMADKIVGLYSSSYTKPDNSKKRIATSKFEPTYARQAFPCFDEPALKAVFEITLVYPNEGDYHALSNMDIAQEQFQGAYTEVHFNKSVPMSTYLACFIVSDFKSKDVKIDTKGIGEEFDMRVFATPEQLDKVDFALNVGKGVIEYYIDYFQIPYPLPKLDMAAIPDFVSGAMEHWGLVTYRETSLLYDEAVSSTANKQRIASVIAHEFAHMWFGNLVTMMWWNDLWLNEGFASYIENKGVEAIYPEWKMRDQFITNTLHGVLALDATLGSHPIIQTVANPDQITEIFDTITYSKGSSIIRMLDDFLGDDNFEHAVTNYLNEFKYKNAVTDDFLTEIEKLNLGFDVKAIMRTWTEQMGLPVVVVQQLSATEYKLTQKRFFSNPKDYDGTYDDSPFDYKWSIPITYKTSASDVVKLEWFYYDQSDITITLPNAVDWIKFNFDQIGYYRVHYPINMWKNLADKLIETPNVFSVGDRACLLNDAFSLADATQLEYDLALDMTQYLSKEDQYVPWSVAASKLTSLKRSLMFTDAFVDYNSYSRDLIAPIYETVGWEVGTDHLQNRLRVTILSAACSLGLPTCLSQASQEFNKWLENPNERPHPDVRETIYYYGMFDSGDEEKWNKMWDLFVNEEDASEKAKLMYGLSAVQVPWILSRYIQLAWNPDNVRGQDYFTCLQYIAANPVGESLVWEYVREHWEDLVERFGLNERYLGSMIPTITGRFDTETKYEEMVYFFEKYPEAGAGTAARVRALENVKNNIAWLENNLAVVRYWLSHRNTLLKEVILKGLLDRPVVVTVASYETIQKDNKMLGNNKIIRLIMCWAVLAFTVSTVVLAFQHTRLNADISDAKEKLDYMESLLEGEIKPRSRRSLADEEINYRLPSALKPTLYDLYLDPNLQTGNFGGKVVITIDVVEESQQIILHSHKLDIKRVYVQSQNALSLEVVQYTLDTVREFLVIDMKEKLIVGAAITLGIEFEGVMFGKIVGLYSSTYNTPENQKRTIATSKFEPTYARQAFPCFDEPNMKAKFRVTLVIPTGDNYHALSNMNQESTTPLDERTEVHFAESVDMSTYLVCFLISDFASSKRPVHAEYGDDFEIQIFATAHQLAKTEFAADTAAAVTEFYIRNYKVEYPLPKLDMAAIPDFASNAMEHWGLVTYRETALLYDRSFSSTWNKQRIAAVIAHELAHMWFGNLVTMNWWNDLWLNEGFARFMEYKGINEIYTDWGLPDQFLIHALHGVMKYDSSVASHPIVQTVENPDQITEIFDTISYEKGASVIRMLEDIVGVEKFELAVTNYLNKFKYQNAVTDDFLTEVANTEPGFDVKLMMRTWTEQMGLPVIDVKRTSATTFELTQKRFFSNIEDYDKVFDDSEFNYKWTIPLTYFYDHDATVRRAWFNYDESAVTVSVPIQTKWLKFNSHQVGYYRINYEETMWHEITSDLVANPEKFDVADRAHLLNDVFALADGSQVPYGVALDMTTYLEKETDFVPWYVAATKLQALQGNLMQTESYMKYLHYARGLMAKVYEQVTWNVDENNHLKK